MTQAILRGLDEADEPSVENLDDCPTPLGALSLRSTAISWRGSGWLGSTVLLPMSSSVASGLFYTAQAVLDRENAASRIVVEIIEPVIEWHRDGLLPIGAGLCGDDRCRFAHGESSAMAEGDDGSGAETAGRRFDAFLVDIDFCPEALLDDRSQSFCRPESFLDKLGTVFPDVRAGPVSFHNPLQDRILTVHPARSVGRDAA